MMKNWLLMFVTAATAPAICLNNSQRRRALWHAYRVALAFPVTCAHIHMQGRLSISISVACQGSLASPWPFFHGLFHNCNLALLLPELLAFCMASAAAAGRNMLVVCRIRK